MSFSNRQDLENIKRLINYFKYQAVETVSKPKIWH